MCVCVQPFSKVSRNDVIFFLFSLPKPTASSIPYRSTMHPSNKMEGLNPFNKTLLQAHLHKYHHTTHMTGITKALPLRESKIPRTATLRAKPTHTRQIQMQMHASSTPAASASPSSRKAICPACARRHVLLQCRHHPPHQRRARPLVSCT